MKCRTKSVDRCWGFRYDTVTCMTVIILLQQQTKRKNSMVYRAIYKVTILPAQSDSWAPMTIVNILKLRHTGHHENVWFPTEMSLKSVPKGLKIFQRSIAIKKKKQSNSEPGPCCSGAIVIYDCQRLQEISMLQNPTFSITKYCPMSASLKWPPCNREVVVYNLTGVSYFCRDKLTDLIDKNEYVVTGLKLTKSQKYKTSSMSRCCSLMMGRLL